jgi:hypothetical protein
MQTGKRPDTLATQRNAAMPDDALRPALCATLRYNEISDGSPYRLSFAGKGNSGASFGFMQGDLAAHQPMVIATFQQVLQAANIPQPMIDTLFSRLSVHLVENPLTQAQTDQVDAALAASARLVDAMDETLLGGVLSDLDTCIGCAQANSRQPQPTAQLYLACWINMTGAPTTVLTWIEGAAPALDGPTPPIADVIDGALTRAYLAATHYFTVNPGNLAHLDQAVAHGTPLLPPPPIV